MKTMAQVEIEHLLSVLSFCHGDRMEAARVLGIGKTTVYRHLREHGMISNTPKLPLTTLAEPLRTIKQSRFLRLPKTQAEHDLADLQCPKCRVKVLLPNTEQL